MLSFFTDPYEDEILYSAIARYHYYYGNADYKDTLFEIFGSRSAIPSIAFPSRLNYLSDQLTNKIYSSSYFIEKHTLYPFYSPFLSKKMQDDIVALMKNGGGKGIHAKIGMTAGSICNKEGLYYCPICAQGDVNKYGDAYFHRVHQLQGVFLCPHHNCKILRYPVTNKESSRILFIRLEKYRVESEYMYETDSKTADILIEIAKSAMFLLDHKLHFDNQVIYKKYMNLLAERSLLTCNGGVKQQKLFKEFTDYYGKEILNKLESNIDPKNDYNWLKLLLRKPKRVIHPIRHILLILFLCGNVKDFFKNEIELANPFGNGPWPCLNSAAVHYSKNVIRKCSITADYKTRQPVGTFICSCGFIYSRKGPDKNSGDRFKIGRIKKFGATWEIKLNNLLLMEKFSLRELARLMGCDPKTIQKYSGYIKNGNPITPPEAAKEQRSTNVTETSEIYKNDILKLLKNKPSLTRNEVRKYLKKQYIWFYRKDKVWLDNNLPIVVPKGKRNSDNGRINWKERDALLKQQVVIIYKTLLQSEKPIRITKSLIGKKLDKTTLIYRCSEKLPETTTLIGQVIESVEDFQIRRVNLICSEYFNKNCILKKWEIEKLAGLRPGYSQKVAEIINENLHRYLSRGALNEQ